MNARAISPTTGAVLALILGTAGGAGWFWLKAGGEVGRALSMRRAAQADEDRRERQQRAHGWDFWTIEMENLASELKDAKAGLQKRSDDLDRRQAQLESEKQELDEMRAGIEGMQREIDARVVGIRADEVKNLKTLASTYASIAQSSPANAVAIFKEMDDATVVKILSLMKPDVVAAIFGQMAQTTTADGTLASRAAQISDKLRLMKATQTAGP